jgi:superfamily II DNA or RNA helicase
MGLTDQLGAIVPPAVRDRGRELHHRGAVHIYRANDLEVRAYVMGSRMYPVDIANEAGELRVECGCPYFAGDAGICKHLWAAFLAADAAGYLSTETALDTDDLGDLELGDDDLARTLETFRRETPPSARYDPWVSQLRAIQAAQDRLTTGKVTKEREIRYLIDVNSTVIANQLTLNIVYREVRKDGSWSNPKPFSIAAGKIAALKDVQDRQILSMVLGTADPWSSSHGYYGYSRDRSIPGTGVTIPASMTDVVVPLICRTGRGGLLTVLADEPVTLSLDEGPPWELWIEMKGGTEKDAFRVQGSLRRGEETMPLTEPALLLPGGFVIGPDGVVAGFEDFGSFSWVPLLRRQGAILVPPGQADRFLTQLMKMPRVPRVKFPPDLEYTEVQGTPVPFLQIKRQPKNAWSSKQDLEATLNFDYEGETISGRDGARGVLKRDPRRLILRNRELEDQAGATLKELGVKPNARGELHLTATKMPSTVRTLTELGWRVEAEGSLYRSAGLSQVNISSGIDWFELQGQVAFGDQVATLPKLLAAVRRGEDFVVLDDGSIGLVPEEWLQRFAAVANLGTAESDGLRFKLTQASLLDALLAAQPDIEIDQVFSQMRDRLRSFDGVAALPEPSGFQGELRVYQREGLGWFGFLREFGFGGCLADDMGLGKTVQVLALLEARREMRQDGTLTAGPSLIVVPRSLVFNWQAEAERFTPKLRILNHTGARLAPGSHFEEYDIILTTYGTLRRDAALLTEVRFDYAILDEAQAIKNASTASAKAARLLQADHRLALSGTPIENHLGELWSLFEFLNPGMLGAARVFANMVSERTLDSAGKKALARALRPFILRRTKEQVAKDLPQKTEQTQFCELAGPQRKQYDELRDHYRRDLLERVDREGIAKSKMFVLEALLRLRQAACHPGLIDPARSKESSAKLDVLLPQLMEVAEEGHKAIVFSQFTKMLGIVRPKLDEHKIVYEYLDGRTRDRQARVERFQNDPDCKLFLISLKAGGLGLNLTAAEYVFLLDPWWNPAVEAQAIDRAHRIGQMNPVFAYRLIAKDTVEEKVLQLQDSKRALADAIIGADNSLIRQIGRDDLELLLS